MIGDISELADSVIKVYGSERMLAKLTEDEKKNLFGDLFPTLQKISFFYQVKLTQLKQQYNLPEKWLKSVIMITVCNPIA